MLKLGLTLGFFVFIVSRLLILFYFQPYLSDVHLYFNQAQKAFSGLVAYHDFFYPYPPLSQIPIYLAYALGGTDFDTYRFLFNFECFAIELLMTIALMRFLKHRLQWSGAQCFSGMCILAFTGLAQGHLLYDRLDVILAQMMLGLLLLVLRDASFGKLALLSNLGVLFKFVPVLPASFLLLLTEKKPPKITLLFKLALLVIPSACMIYLIERFYAPGILRYLGEHQVRGIQIESTWASPFLLWKSIFESSLIAIENNFGAQHLSASSTPIIYQAFSRYFGFLVFGAWAIYLLYQKVKPTIELKMLTPFLAILIFLCTQRVLSVQFLIWLMPFLAIAIPLLKNRLSWIVMTFLIYSLTFIAFDCGYFKIVAFDPIFVGALAARNLLLVVFTGMVAREWVKRSKAG